MPAFDLRALFGIAGPDRVPCLSARYHLAYKLHGMTRPPTDEAPNERVQDAVDALPFREPVTDLAAIRAACVDVFAARGTHAWRPDLWPLDVAPPGDWAGRFAELAADLELPERDLDAGTTALRTFIAAIDAATGAG